MPAPMSPKKLFKRLLWGARWRAKKHLYKPVWRLYWWAIKYLPHTVSRVRRWLGLNPGVGGRFRVVLDTYDAQGLVAACELVDAFDDMASRAKGYHLLARRELSVNVVQAASLAEKSLVCDRSHQNCLRNCMTLWDAGNIEDAHRLLIALPEETLNPAEQEKALQIMGAHRLCAQLPDVSHPERSSPAYDVDPHCVLYVASSSRPYHTTGYTTRTHHLLESLTQQGWKVHCVTRPGYPHDRPDARNLELPVLNVIDGVPYERLPGKHRREVSYEQYLLGAADELERAARRLRPALIHAASNYEAALPALIAARRLGVPFCYEVRGLWEFTAASKKAGWEQTQRFELDRRLESHAAANADRVFTLTKALATELVSRGVDAGLIDLLPNAVNLSFFKRRDRDQALANQLGLRANTFVCGYIGSVVKYEGLDDLISAMPALIRRVPDCKLLIVGDGDVLIELKELASQLGVRDYVVFTGKVPHAEVARYFSLLSTIALPRKPYTVCKLVSPLKPFEAMAMGVPLVVSDVDALGEIFEHGETALLHVAGDCESLAQCLIQLAESPALCQRLVKNALAQVSRESQWHQVLRPLTDFYARKGVLRVSGGDRKGRIRVLTVGSIPPEWGGATGGGVATIHRVVLENWLADTGNSAIEVVGVLPNNGSRNPSPDLPAGLKVFEPPENRVEEKEWYLSLLQQERIDCVLFFHVANRWAYWHAHYGGAVPAVGAIHSWSAIKNQPDQASVQKIRDRIQSTLPHFAGLIFPSKHCVSEGEKLGFRYDKRPLIIPNSIGPEFIAQPFPVGGQKARVIFVGALKKVKRIDLLIRAAVNIGIDLVVVGEGEEFDSLNALAKEISTPGQVTFLGHCDPARVAAEVASSSLLCGPSESESFGIAYLEAIACGIPVVGFSPTLAEIEALLGVSVGVGVDGDADLPVLVDAIKTVLATDYDAARLRESVTRCCGTSAVAAGYQQAIERGVAVTELHR